MLAGVRIERWQAGDGASLSVVIDVLRATTTALVLLERVDEVAVVADPESLGALPARPWLLVSELSRTAALGPRIDNSPARAAEVDLAGRTPCLVTTNGSRALCAAAAGGPVLVAGFVNLSATVAEIRRRAPERVSLLPAGDFAPRVPHLEDEKCADALAAALAGRHFDVEAALAEVRNEPRVLKRLQKESALAADLDVALSVDLHDRAAEFFAAGPVAGWIRRCG